MTHINQRRDSAANWTSSDPVLQLGEVGWEVDTRRAKIGDGSTAWNALDYIVEEGVTSVNGDSGPAVVLTKADIGLGNVDNTPDSAKPISTAQAAALADKADIDSPVFTGNPSAPTPSAGDDDTTIATTAFVQNELDDYGTEVRVLTNKDLTDSTNEFPSDLARVLGAVKSTADTASIGTGAETNVLDVPFEMVLGAVYKATAFLQVSNDTAGAYSAVRLFTTPLGGPNTEVGENVLDHRLANRRMGASVITIFTGTANDPDHVLWLGVIAGSGLSTVHGSETPVTLILERIA